jgi:hypothetical protein
MSDPAWQRDTAIRNIRKALEEVPAPPLSRIIADVANYVGAEPSKVETWWKGRGR